MRGIDLLLDRQVPLKLKSTVMKTNVDELPSMRSFAETLGLGFRFDPLLNTCIDGDKTPISMRLPVEDAVALDLADSDRHQALAERFSNLKVMPFDQTKLYRCGAGKSSFHISPYGRLTGCLLAQEPQASLRRVEFCDAWSVVKETQATQRTRSSPCTSCEIASLCTLCPAWSQLECGDPETIVPYLCELSHLRASTFGDCGIG